MADPPSPKRGPMHQKHHYTKQQLDDALQAIRNGMPFREAERRFHIPRTTLRDISKNKYSRYWNTGPHPILSVQEEQRIEEWISASFKAGFPLLPDDVITCAQSLLAKQHGVTQPQTKVTRSWLRGFLKRHPQVAERVPEKLSLARASVSEERIRHWFQETRSYLEEQKCLDILQDPTRIFNMDETAFRLCPETKKVLCPKGERNVYEVASSSEKECITVLVSCQASGSYVPPMVIYPYVRVPADIKLNAPAQWATSGTKSGWMTSEVFFEYICNVFYQWLKDDGIKRPVLLFVDGHKSHMSMPLSEFCAEKGIVLVALPPNTTHMLQPLDVAVFSGMKAQWKTVLHDYRAKSNIDTVIGKRQFAGLLSSVLDLDATVPNIVSGFRKCGIYPWNPDAVDYTKCLKDKARQAASVSGETVPSEHVCPSICDAVERKLDRETLRNFQETARTTKTWDGPEKYQILFELWLEHHDATPLDSVTAEPIPSPALPTPSASSTPIGLGLGLPNPETADATTPQRTVDSSPPSADPLDTPVPSTSGTYSSPCATPAVGDSPFKMVAWPNRPKNPAIRRRLHEPHLPIVSGARWRLHNQAKDDDKALKERQKEERKQERERKKAKKEMAKRKRFPSTDTEEEEALPLGVDEGSTSSDPSEDEETEETDIRLEEYYAVYYDHRYYIGRVTKALQDGRFEVKFLQETLEDEYIWPKHDDMQIVERRFLFKGPLHLTGHGPFRLNTRPITLAYRQMKKDMGII